MKEKLRKIFIIFGAVIFLLTSGYKGYNIIQDFNKGDKKLLLGKWAIVDLQKDAATSDGRVSFLEDGTFTMSYNIKGLGAPLQVTEQGNYTLKGDQLQLEPQNDKKESCMIQFKRSKGRAFRVILKEENKEDIILESIDGK